MLLCHTDPSPEGLGRRSGGLVAASVLLARRRTVMQDTVVLLAKPNAHDEHTMIVLLHLPPAAASLPHRSLP
jgi:hypothetical protein